jgi:predicted site-specific integrase-resolvase
MNRAVQTAAADVMINTSLAARMLGYSTNTVTRWIEAGVLRACRPHRTARWRVSMLSVQTLRDSMRRQVELGRPLLGCRP